jgi:L-lactate dehydrogenase complex protein LldG
VVEAGHIVAAIPDAVALLAEAAAEGRPVTFVSGPSATSDIELDRVIPEGGLEGHAPAPAPAG